MALLVVGGGGSSGKDSGVAVRWARVSVPTGCVSRALITCYVPIHIAPVFSKTPFLPSAVLGSLYLIPP